MSRIFGRPDGVSSAVVVLSGIESLLCVEYVFVKRAIDLGVPRALRLRTGRAGCNPGQFRGKE